MSGRPNLSCMMRRHFCHHLAVSYNLCQMRVHLFVYTLVFTFATTWQYGTTYASCRFIFFFGTFCFTLATTWQYQTTCARCRFPFCWSFFFLTFGHHPVASYIIWQLQVSSLSLPLSLPPPLSPFLYRQRALALSAVRLYRILFICLFIRSLAGPRARHLPMWHRVWVVSLVSLDSLVYVIWVVSLVSSESWV